MMHYLSSLMEIWNYSSRTIDYEQVLSLDLYEINTKKLHILVSLSNVKILKYYIEVGILKGLVFMRLVGYDLLKLVQRKKQ